MSEYSTPAAVASSWSSSSAMLGPVALGASGRALTPGAELQSPGTGSHRGAVLRHHHAALDRGRWEPSAVHRCCSPWPPPARRQPEPGRVRPDSRRWPPLRCPELQGFVKIGDRRTGRACGSILWDPDSWCGRWPGRRCDWSTGDEIQGGGTGQGGFGGDDECMSLVA